ncbi:phosphoglycerate dehydrogenase [Enterococcus canis]|uniref:Phosphoglycerate dehydrogenase n=1 Tax=Enterococcus canis TaxID=214095 RepID=A0A1L8RGB8_9ENTE|nr:2-hydroxyacid dehydrogenase family protein [Enterococcus canis]OJG18816.1 phosphoglycerate dehydrogenase [Enterococcus canis]
MAQIYLSAKIPEKGIQLLKQSRLPFDLYDGAGVVDKDTLRQAASQAEVLITSLSTIVDASIIDHAPNLKLIANFGAGFNNIAVDYAKEKGIMVTNTPFVSTDATAELTAGLIIALSRRIVEGDHLMRTTGFSGWAPLFFLGHELKGKTLGIIGMGQIGQGVAQRLRAFGMKIVYSQRHRLASDVEQALKAEYLPIEKVLAQADVVSIHTPLTSGTYHLIDEVAFSHMKPSAFLINASRGPIVSEEVLIKALQQQKIAGAALDVYEFEPKVSDTLKDMSQVILTPHIGNATVEARDAMAVIVAENALAVLKGQKPQYIVNA